MSDNDGAFRNPAKNPNMGGKTQAYLLVGPEQMHKLMSEDHACQSNQEQIVVLEESLAGYEKERQRLMQEFTTRMADRDAFFSGILARLDEYATEFENVTEPIMERLATLEVQRKQDALLWQKHQYNLARRRKILADRAYQKTLKGIQRKCNLPLKEIGRVRDRAAAQLKRVQDENTTHT